MSGKGLKATPAKLGKKKPFLSKADRAKKKALDAEKRLATATKAVAAARRDAAKAAAQEEREKRAAAAVASAAKKLEAAKKKVAAVRKSTADKKKSATKKKAPPTKKTAQAVAATPTQTAPVYSLAHAVPSDIGKASLDKVRRHVTLMPTADLERNIRSAAAGVRCTFTMHGELYHSGQSVADDLDMFLAELHARSN